MTFEDAAAIVGMTEFTAKPAPVPYYVLAADHSHQVHVAMTDEAFRRNWHGRICNWSSRPKAGVPVRACDDFSAWLDEQAADKRRPDFRERQTVNYWAAQDRAAPVVAQAGRDAA